jgi:hypothetical protein
MKLAWQIGGLFLLVGGSIQLLWSVAMLRRGAPWRGLAVGGAALAVYGALLVAGVLPSPSRLGVGSVFLVAGLAWTGVRAQRRGW